MNEDFEMESLPVISDQENQRVLSGKENIVKLIKKNVQSKDERVVFGNISENIEISQNVLPTKNKISKLDEKKITYNLRSTKEKDDEIAFGDSAFQIYSDDDDSLIQTKNQLDTDEKKKQRENGEDLRELTCQSKKLNKDFSSSPESDASSAEEVFESTHLETKYAAHKIPYDYINENYSYLRKLETINGPNPDYMKKQQSIKESMREIMIDWMAVVAVEFRFNTATLYLAANYVDRFLSKMSVTKEKLQLVGTTALMIAAKMEEVDLPGVRNYVDICADTYTKNDFIKMESIMLKLLRFDLAMPTAYDFLNHYCIHANLTDKEKFFAMYLCELTLLRTDPYLKFLPSYVAAASIALAQHTLQEKVWPQQLVAFTGYSLPDLQDCVIPLEKTFKKVRDSSLKEIRKKYESQKYMRVSLIFPRSTDLFDNIEENKFLF